MCVVFLILATTVQATIIANNIKCADPGYIVFTAFYGCSKDCPREPTKNFSEVKISAKSAYGIYELKIEDPPEYLEEKTYQFVSTGKLLDRHGGYTLRLDDGERIKSYDIICPNEDYLCEKIDLSIDLCAKDKENFYYLFHGLRNQFSDDELREEIDYYINPANTYLGSVTLASKQMGTRPMKSENLPETSEVKNLGSDRYVLTVPIRDLKNRVQESMYMEIKGCDKDIHDSAALKICEERTCSSDNHCPIGAYCKENICKTLSCAPCEEIEEHSCVSTCIPENPCEEGVCKNNECQYTRKEDCCLKDEECNDNDICTEDICANNKCIHENIMCEASDDPCVIGTCKSNQGCIYVSNPECFTEEPDETTRKIPIQNLIMSNAGIISARVILLILLVAIFLFIVRKRKISKKRKRKK